MIWQGSIKIGFNGKDLKLTIGSRYIIGRAGATGTVSGLRPGAVIFPGTATHAVTRSAEDSFKLFRLAVGAFELHLIVLLHNQYFEAFVTF